MNFQQFEKEVTDNRLREKMESTLHGWLDDKFGPAAKQYKHHIPDAVMTGFCKSAQHYQRLDGAGGFYKWLESVCLQELMDVIKQEKSRRKILKAAHGQFKRDYKAGVYRKDPMRHIDWKIDLERAIKAVVPAGPLQAAMWHHVYEGYTAEEVIAMLPVNDRATRTWERHFQEAKRDLDAEMKRKHYKGV